SSDTTYRIHDWGRPGLDGRPRPLHLREARAVRARPAGVPCPYTTLGRARPPVTTLIDCPAFQIDGLRLQAGGGWRWERGGGRPGFSVLIGIEGRGAVRAAGGGPGCPLERGRFVLVPAVVEAI